jgi:hypothetical protein
MALCAGRSGWFWRVAVEPGRFFRGLWFFAFSVMDSGGLSVPSLVRAVRRDFAW